jgi:RNA polymerase sigma-70 factor (ECF subfamily)
VPEDLTWRQVVLNGAPALVGMQGGRVFGTLSLATDGEAISGLFFVRNPDKLGALTVH